MAKVKEQNEITLTTLECQRCGHTWPPRRRTTPEICPKCKSRKWNEPVEADPTAEENQSASERRAVGNLIRLMREGHPVRTKVIVRLLETECELLS